MDSKQSKFPRRDNRFHAMRTEFRAVEGNARRKIISFSSEEPYQRWYGLEILDHSDGAVDLQRLNEIGCVLFNHSRDTVIGKVIRAWVEDSRGCAEIAFDTDEESERVFQKVESGTLKGVSVGYRVDSWEEILPGKTSADGKFTGPCTIARKWTPLEVSIVSVPADATVGVGRDAEYLTGGYDMDENRNNPVQQVPTATEQLGAARSQAPEAPAERSEQPDPPQTDMVERERRRAAEITALCRDFSLDPQPHIRSGASLEETRAWVLQQLRKSCAPVSVRVERDEGDKFRDAAADAVLMRAGLSLSAPSAGAKERIGMSLRDLAIECLQRDGQEDCRRMSADELYSVMARQFFNPSAAFPSIMDQTIRKSYVNGYEKAGVTFDRWTTKGVLTDFKTTQAGYLVGSAGELLLVPEGGELQHDLPTDHRTPTRKLETYGRQFSMSRQAFINDDIGFLTTIPARYAASARKTINKQVYSLLSKNPKIYDGTALFDKSHGNLIATGTGITSAALQEAILKLQMQRDQDGDAIIATPAYLVAPVGYGFTIRTILASPTIQTEENTQAVNPLYGMGIEVVEDPTLNVLAGTGAAPWFVVAAKDEIKTIQVDYLNGQEIPNIRRGEKPGQLGFVWDIYLDWGVSVLDYRGIVKNPGVAISI